MRPGVPRREVASSSRGFCEGGVEAAPEHRDGAEPGDGADHDPAVLDGQILPLQQHEAEVAGDVGVLEVGVVERPRRQDGDARIRFVGQALQRVAKGTEESGQAMDVGLGVEVGKDAARRHPVLQREARARGCLGAVAEHPPRAVRATADLEGDEVEVVNAAGGDADERAQPLAAAGDEPGGKVSVGHEPVRAIEVGHHRLEQIRSLDQAAGEDGRLFLLHEDGDMRERPGALARTLGAVLAIEDTGVAQVLVAARKATLQVRRGQIGEMVDEGPPDRADVAMGIEQLVGDAGRRAVVREQAGCRIISVDAPYFHVRFRVPGADRGSWETRAPGPRQAGRSRRRSGRSARSERAGGLRPRCR